MKLSLAGKIGILIGLVCIAVIVWLCIPKAQTAAALQADRSTLVALQRNDIIDCRRVCGIIDGILARYEPISPLKGIIDNTVHTIEVFLETGNPVATEVAAIVGGIGNIIQYNNMSQKAGNEIHPWQKRMRTLKMKIRDRQVAIEEIDRKLSTLPK